jgi:hypothetical protein
LKDKITLHFTLPKTYPSQSNPIVTFSALNLSKTDHHALQTILRDLLSSLSSSTEERLLEIIESFTSSIPSASASTSTAESTILPQSVSHVPDFVVLIWFHHLLSTTKRKAILSLHSLRGISKPGYPGILVLQGPKNILDDAIVELKGMNWQAMQVRGEIESHEKFLDKGIHEVETVAEIVAKMEVLGLGDWCLVALRMK